MPSIVVPAHDEELRIGALLHGLAPLAGEVEVVVVCNGCTDASAEAARVAAPWAAVVELPDASKPAALDAGDAAVRTFPRLYLDADVTIDARSVRALFSALGTGRLQAVAATPSYALAASSAVVRSHYALWTRMGANNRGLAGTNAMAVSAAGRERFEAWPRLIGDDYFLDGLFTETEKARVPQARVVRPAPRGAWDCMSRKARIHQGNVDVRRAALRSGHGGGGLGGVLAVVRAEPVLAVHLPAHVAITFGARLLSAWRRRRGTSQVWYRDRSRATTRR